MSSIILISNSRYLCVFWDYTRLENTDKNNAERFSVPADYRMGTVFYSKIRPIGCCWIGYAAGKDCQEYSAIGCSTKNKLDDYL